MDRRQKIMKLIVDELAEFSELQYTYTGALTGLDANLVSMDFVVRQGQIRGDFSIRGMIDMPVQLQAQYDNRTILNDHPLLQSQIEKDLRQISNKINRLL